MAGEWRELAVEEFAEVVGGGTPSTADERNFGGDIPWITPKDLSNYGFRYIERGERNITEKGLLESNATLLPAGAVLLSTRAPVGYLAIAKNPLTTNQGFKSLVVRDGFDNEFVFYLLKANVEYLKSQASGTTFGELSGTTLRKLKFLIPPLPEQRAIAAVLGALDDKIELNRRMNRTLEAIAQAVFRHWFVENEEAEGWEVGKFSDISFIARDVINPAQFPSEVFNHYSIPAYDEKRFPISELGSQIKSSKFVVPNNCVLISKLNPEIPRIWLPFSLKGRSICSTEFLVNVPTGYFSPEYLYGLFHSQSFQDRFISMVTGTSGSHQRVKAEYLLDMDIELPPENLVKRYTETVKPLFQKVQQNILESRTLAVLRDALLPKLLRGEVRVAVHE
jgi:type I restriction enzyme S subunit